MKKQLCNENPAQILHPFFIRVIVLFFLFFVFKLTIILKTGTGGFLLPGYYFADFLVVLFISLIAFANRRIADVVSDATVLFYFLNVVYSAFFTCYIDASLFQYMHFIPNVAGSVVKETYFWPGLLLVLAIIFVLPFVKRFLVNIFFRLLKTGSSLKIFIILISVLVLSNLIGLFLKPPDELIYKTFRRDPFSSFIYSFIYNDNDVKIPESLDSISKYPNTNEHGTVPPKLCRFPEKRLNLIFILLESTSSISLGTMAERIMPNIFKLAENGIYFDNFYVSVPLSIKTIFTIHSGYYPNPEEDPISFTNPRIPLKALPWYFKEHGYRTALLHGGFFKTTKKLAFLSDRGYDVILDAEKIPVEKTYERSSWGIDDQAVYEYAKKWINESSEPFFLLLIPIFPHYPYMPPLHWKSRSSGEGKIDYYHNSINYEDTLVGGLIDFLKEEGRFKDTVFIIMADHGQAFNQHTGNYYHNRDLYEENIRVPLVISNPQLFPNPQRDGILCATIDIYPTILDIFGYKDEQLRGIDGISLFAPVKGRMLFLYAGFGGPKLGIRDGDYKFIYRPLIDHKELFDLVKDQEERINISGIDRERVDYYTKKVLEWRAFSRDFILGFR